MLGGVVFGSLLVSAVAAITAGVLVQRTNKEKTFPYKLHYGMSCNLPANKHRDRDVVFAFNRLAELGLPVSKLKKLFNETRLNIVFPTEDELYVKMGSGKAAGWVDKSTGTVFVVEGKRGLAALAHEMFHMYLMKYYGSYDIGHKDTKWKSL